MMATPPQLDVITFTSHAENVKGQGSVKGQSVSQSSPRRQQPACGRSLSSTSLCRS